MVDGRTCTVDAFAQRRWVLFRIISYVLQFDWSADAKRRWAGLNLPRPCREPIPDDV